MLWKSSSNPPSRNGTLNKSTPSTPPPNGNEGGTLSPPRRRRYGVVIYPFQNYGEGDKKKEFLWLELGDCVVIHSSPASGWYFGWKKYFPEVKGLFPASHVNERRGSFSSSSELLSKLSEVCREWGEIRKKLFVESYQHQYQFDAIGRGLFELIEGRRTLLLNQSLTQDQYHDLTRKLCTRIDWGNRKLGLDLVPWNWLAEEDPGLEVEDDEAQNSRILPDCSKDAGRLFKLHQKSMDSSASRGTSTTFGSATLTRKGKKGLLDPLKSMNDLYVSLRDFSYTCTDECEISFSLYDGKHGFISERHNILRQHSSSSFHLKEEKERPTVFKDVNVSNRRELYLVVQIIRIGKMFCVENSAKKTLMIGSPPVVGGGGNKNRKFRRPYGCGVLSLWDVETISDPEEVELSVGLPVEKLIKLFNPDEKDFYQAHDLIISQSYKNNAYKIMQIPNSFSVSIFWCASHMFTPKSSSTSSQPPFSFTKMIGVHSNLIAPPGVVRNDLYLTLRAVELLEKRQNKTGGAKSCNLEVELQIIDDEDDLVSSLEGNCWKSVIIHHTNYPKYNETVKFSIPIEMFPKCKIRCIFRHCSAKDKTDKKMFGVAWMNLMDPSGTTLKDGDHSLRIYKWTDESSLPVISSNLHLSKDTAILRTLMVSTKFTQNMDLVNLLKWKQTKDLKPSLQNLIKSQEATEEIVRKFLQDVLDALFTIFSDDSGNSTEYSGDVFTLLVNIFQLLRNPNYGAYKTVLNAYCNEHFAAALVYKGLLQSLRHYTTVLLNSVTEDITQLIQNCYESLQFIFKFVVQSQILFAKATGGQLELEDSFRRDVKSLISSFSLVFSCTDCSPVFVETQSILLQNLDSVYEHLLKVMPLMDVCTLVCEIFRSIPLKEGMAHALSPAKLSAIHSVVKSPLFRTSSSSRALLLPVFCKHIRHHLMNREELRLCTDVLSEILMFLHSIRNVKEEKAHADIEVVCTTCLEMLVQSILVLERTSSIVGNLVTCLISLLEQMDHCHYNRVWDEFHERKPLRDLLLRVFLLFRDLIRHDCYPKDWSYMKLLTNHVVLLSLQEFCQPLVTDFLKFFDVQLWAQYFNLAVTFINQPGLQLENFKEWKREWIVENYKDMRLTMGYQLLHLWSHLGDEEKKNFIPNMIGPFLEVTMTTQEELRLVTLQRLFYDMMWTEWKMTEDIKETESELIERLDLLINNTSTPYSDGSRHFLYGDDEYRLKFRELHLQRLEAECTKSPNPKWLKICSTTIESLANLQQLLLDYREVAKGEASEISKDKLMQCTVNLLDFYRAENRIEQYLRYIYKLHDLHLSCENYTEAGFTLLLHGHSLLSWNRDKMLSETYGDFGLIHYPRQRESERKEWIYLKVLEYFDKGKVWEKGISLCKELAELYERRYDYTKLSRILRTQATFYENILQQHRPEPEYFRVSFIGQGFPLFVRNKEFVYRGQEYERLGTFMQRIVEDWPQAQMLQKSNAPPDKTLLDSSGQFLQICNVKPKSGGDLTSLSMPEKIRAFYLVNDVSWFQYDRRIDKGVAEDPNNEFKSMWVERTILKTSGVLPSTLRWAEVMEKTSVELSPIEFACEKMDEANLQLHTLINHYSSSPEDALSINVNPLSMRLQGMLDAAVMGGIPKYSEAFFNEDFILNSSGDTADFVLRLIALLQDQVKLLEEGLEIHGKLVPPGVQPLHKRLIECHSGMKASVSEMEGNILSILSKIGPPSLRRSESGIRESLRSLRSCPKSIVNSPLPPVPQSHGKLSNPKKISLNSSSGSNRSSVVSTASAGYGHVMRVGASARNAGTEDDDDYYYLMDDEGTSGVYSQVEVGEVSRAGNGSPAANRVLLMGRPQSTNPSVSTTTAPPSIPSRISKAPSPRIPATEGNNEYIFMPPSRLREIEKQKGTSPTPPPPKFEGTGNGNQNITSPSPPPLLPRKPTTSTSSVSSTCTKTSTDPPPPVPPKPSSNVNNSQFPNDSTYMNKAELIVEIMDRNNANSPTPSTTKDGGTINRRSGGGSSGHKEYFVPPAVKEKELLSARNSSASSN